MEKIYLSLQKVKEKVKTEYELKSQGENWDSQDEEFRDELVPFGLKCQGNFP